MNKFISIVSLFFLTACTATEVPIVQSAPPLTPTNIPPPTTILTPFTPETILPTATAAPLQTRTPTSTPANQRISSVDGMPEAYIPAGTFHMGGMDVRRAPNETPVHEVTLHAFWMDQLEVTNAMYALCVNSGGCTPPQSFKSQRRPSYFNNPEFNDYPVIYVTWGQANAYCKWAGRQLPTEAQWERAGRGDDFRTFPWGEDKADGLRANFNMLVGDTSRVGSYPLGASPFGVLDMAGNVAEWINDVYSSYANAGALDPTGPAENSSLYRVVRGGSLGDAEINIRVSKRSSVLESEVSPRIGFRCAAEER